MSDHSMAKQRFVTNFSLFLQVECIDFLQLSFESKEEGSLVCLQRYLRILQGLVFRGRPLSLNDRRGA